MFIRLATGYHLFAVLVEDNRKDAEERETGRPGLRRSASRQRGHDVTSRLGLK